MTTLPLAGDGARVTALLVSHEGAGWLPAVLDGVEEQTRRPDTVVAVDTGSTDGSPQLLRDRLRDAAVLEADPTSSYGDAVRAGLTATHGDRAEDEWVWLLHDDSRPAPDALERLLEGVAESPSVSIVGPKLREWPSLRRLLEIGVTISGTGRRETGLERGEYDQGQHDRVHDVLAVNTAGMLVRRAVLEALGFDRHLPLLGNDIDFGWRAARAGHRALVVPAAVVFHVEAAHRGVRRTTTHRRLHTRRAERAGALYTLLVNGSALGLPFRLVRLFLGSLLRALGLLLVRAPGEAGDEIAALAATYARPWRVVAGRRRRRRSATVSHREVRHLLAPPWLPYRHGLDFLSDIAAAVVSQAGDVSAARRARSAESAETGPVPAEAQNLPADSGVLARLVTSPAAWAFLVLTVGAVVAARGLFGAGSLSGGGLLPVPDHASDWWRVYLASWHDIGVGSPAPAAPYLLPLALAGSLLLGKAWLVVDLVFLFAVPLAALGARRFLLRVTSSRPLSLWGAVAYGVLPVVMGAVQQGRLGTVAGALILPWLAHSASFLNAGETVDRRTRAAWRTALWLALLTAFVPTAWFIAALLAVVAVAVRVRSRDRGEGFTGAVLVPIVATLVLLLPWSLSTWTHQGPASWLFEAGLPSPGLTHILTRWDVLLGRPGEGGAPAWMTAGVLVAAVVALVRPDTRRAVLRAWVVIVAALAVTALLAEGTFSLANSTDSQPLWLGFPLLVAQGAGISAAALAGTGIRRRLYGSSFGWRQPLGVLVVVVAALTPVVSAGWWIWTATGGPVDRGRATDVPTYMTDAAEADPLNGVLVIRGSRGGGFDYVLMRQAGIRTGDDSVEPSVADQEPLTAHVENLVTAPDPEDVTGLSKLGVAYIYAPAPADIDLVGNLDSVSGVTPGSAVRPGARAWQLEARPTGADLPGSDSSDRLRGWALLLQALAILVVAVLAAPTRRSRR